MRTVGEKASDDHSQIVDKRHHNDEREIKDQHLGPDNSVWPTKHWTVLGKVESTKVLQNRTGQPKTEPNRHRRWQKKFKPKASVRFRFSLPVSPEAFGFTVLPREIEFLPRTREREGGRGRGSNRI